MTNTYNTGNPLGSTDPRDLYDNASNFDEGMNRNGPTFTDRLGNLRKTWNGMETEFDLAQAGRVAEFQAFLVASGYVSLGNYAAGINFTAYNQYMARDGFFYRPAPSSVPFTTTGTWVGGDEDLFVLMSEDAVLRQDLAEDNGADLVGYLGSPLPARLGQKLYASQHTPAIVDAATLQNFLNLAAGKHLVIDIPVTVTKDGLEALPLFGLTIPAGGVVEWEDGAWTMLEPGVQVRHIFAASGAANSNVRYINPQIDGQGSSANGIGGANATNSRLSNVWVIGGTIKNIARERARDSFEGGSGVTFQYGCFDCGVTGTRFYRVNCPLDATGNGTVQPYGVARAINITFDNIHCEECEMIGHSYDLLALSGTTTDVNAACRWSNITFFNCGRSDEVGSWPGLSFVRVNNAGNSSPFVDTFIPSTSFGGNWQPDTFSAADAEWSSSTPSYAIGARVKVTNDGTLSALFHFYGNAGCVVDGVNGFNEPTYGQIGAIFAGTAGGVNVRNLDVLVDAKSAVHCGAVPNMWPIITRPDRSMVDSQIELSNLGTTVRVLTADAPAPSDATPYRQRGLKVNAVVRRATVTELLDSRIGGAADGWRNRLEVSDCAGAGAVSGTFAMLYAAQNTIPAGTSETVFNRVHCEAMHIKVHQSGNQLRLERTGSSAGSADLAVSGTNLIISTANSMTLDANGGAYRLRNAAGTIYSLTVDASGRLLINGVIVGSQT